MDEKERRKLQELRQPCWWFGIVASPLSVVVSHPMDIVKVAYQSNVDKSVNTAHIIKQIHCCAGFRGFYYGSIASMTRQVLGNGTRSALYNMLQPYMYMECFFNKILLAGVAGIVGSFVGFPADVIIVRQQVDLTLPPETRRKYRNVVEGVYKIYKTEGLRNMYSGCLIVILRGMLVSISSLAFYEQCKQMLKEAGYRDAEPLQFSCSIASAIVGSTLTQPLDIVKMKLVAASCGTYQNTWHAIREIFEIGGPRIFWRGYGLNFLRVCPHTVAIFMILEQLRMHFGYLPDIPI